MPVYVQHQVLAKLPDVFNAEALWQAPGLALFSRRPLLRDLLERAPREQRGRAATRCFSHVTLLLPQEDVDDDRHLTRGARVRDLAAQLAALHQKDFGDLLGGDEVRYDVAGADSLAAGEVAVRFGHAVYLPAPGEAVLYRLSTSRDSAIWRDAGVIYQHQRLALVGRDGRAIGGGAGAPASASSPGDGAILLINDGADAPIEVQARPKADVDCVFDAAAGYYVLRPRGDANANADAAGGGARLLLKVVREIPLPQAAPAADAGADAQPNVAPPIQLKPAAVWKTRATATAGAIDQTALPLPQRAVNPQPRAESDATFAPLARQRVSLVALALPRLSRYRETGARQMEVGVSATLGLAAPGEAPLIAFAVDAGDHLHAITADGRQRIDAPASFTPIDGLTVRLAAVAPAMAERYRALLLLPGLPSLPVAAGARALFGRATPMLAGLRVLDGPRFLDHAGTSMARATTNADATAASADRLGLSRQAFSFEAVNGGYRIVRASPTQALFHLDDRLGFVGVIDNTVDSDAPYLLPSGHHLVAGHYVLRFDA